MSKHLHRSVFQGAAFIALAVLGVFLMAYREREIVTSGWAYVRFFGGMIALAIGLDGFDQIWRSL